MSQMIHRLAEETTPDGVRRIRLARSVDRSAVLNGQPTTRTKTRYLDGTGTHVVEAGQSRSEIPMAFEAVPARTQDVLDLGRLSNAAGALASQMRAHGPGSQPSPEQLAVWLKSYQGLLSWKKAADDRLVKAQGEIDTIGLVLGQFL